MKKLLFLIIAFVSFFMLVGVKQVSATSESEPTLVSTTTETLDDGSYIVTEICIPNKCGARTYVCTKLSTCL